MATTLKMRLKLKINWTSPLKTTETLWLSATVKINLTTTGVFYLRDLHQVMLDYVAKHLHYRASQIFFLPINMVPVIVQHCCLCSNGSLETLITAVQEL